MEGREDWKRYYDNSVIVPSEDTDVIAQAAKEAGAYVVMGLTERDAVNCTLYCTVAFFGPDGSYLGKHRKMKPTGSERLIWGEGDVSTLIAVDTPWGPMGSLICWENYMPLARVALYEKGISLYIAPTADNREDWQTTMKHIALESRTFVVSCNMYATKDMYPQDLNYIHELENLPDRFCPGGTCVIDPFGKYVAEPLWDQEGIVYADLDMNKVPLSRMDFDPTGHYSRPDSLELVIHDRSK
jgi:nitrilase